MIVQRQRADDEARRKAKRLELLLGLALAFWNMRCQFEAEQLEQLIVVLALQDAGFGQRHRNSLPAGASAVRTRRG